MKSLIKTLILFSILVTLSSCNKEIKVRTGRIDIELIVFNNASDEPENAIHIPISKMYFRDNNFIEVLQHKDDFPYVLIKENKFSKFENLSNLNMLTADRFIDLKEKNIGVKFVNDTVRNFEERKVMTDTAFNGYNYKRYSISDENTFAVFYVHQTDSVLPFSLSNQFDNEAKGILNRVDTYEIKEDRFTSLRMTLNDTIPKNFYEALKSLK